MEKRGKVLFLILIILFILFIFLVIILTNIQKEKPSIIKEDVNNEILQAKEKEIEENQKPAVNDELVYGQKIAFQPLAFTEEQFIFTHPRIGAHTVPESSGVVASRVYSGIYWMIGDSDQAARIYATNASGFIKKSFDVLGSTNIDWEDIALDENNNIWISDTGDNAQARADYILYKAAEPDPFGAAATVTAAAHRFIYPDGAKDSEATFIWGGIPYIIQKRPTNARVYAFPEINPSVTVTLNFIGEFNNANNWITGADISRDGKRLALINDGSDFHWIIERDASSSSIADFFNSPTRQWRIQFPQEQAEAITFINNTYDLLITSEYDPSFGTNGIIWKIDKEMYDLTPYNFTFAAAGDLGWNANTNSSLRKLRDLIPAKFFLAIGDMSYGSANTESYWCSMVKSYIGSSFPFELVSGNHEDDSRVNGYIGNFAACLIDQLNSTGTYSAEYSFDYNNLARIIMIDPNIAVGGVTYSYNVGNTHYNWLA